MKLFGHSKLSSYLGVDIGSGGVKIVELAMEKNRMRLLTYGYAEQPVDAPLIPLDHSKETAALLREVMKKAGVKTSVAISALPLSGIFSAIVSVPQQKDQNRLKQDIQDQVRKLAPMPLEEMITYSTFVDPVQKPEKRSSAESVATGKALGKTVRVLVTGSGKNVVQKYIEIFKQAKLELKALDTESFAFIRSLVGKDKTSILIVDIGARRSNMVIVEKGLPFFTRSVNIGGDQLTHQIMLQMKLEREAAEQMKRDLGLGTVGQIPKFMETFLQPLLNEIRYSLERYIGMDPHEHRRVEKVILTGGSAHLFHLSSYLADRLNMNVYVGDPWARVISHPSLRPVLDEIGPRMAVAVGLAMREGE